MADSSNAPAGAELADCPGTWVNPVIDAYKKDVDRTLIREMLQMTVEQRFDALMALQDFATELRGAGKAAVPVVTPQQ
jgi:hypothetical protein